MNKLKMLPIGGRPIYCYRCRGRNTFEHQPENDIKSEDTGQVLWEAWRCKVCGNSTVKSKGGKND